MEQWSIDRIPVSTNDHLLEHEANAFLLTHISEDALLIDAGYADSTQTILQQIERRRAKLHGIYLTHYHPDHSLGAAYLARLTDCPIYCHPLEYRPLLELYASRSIEIKNIHIMPSLVDGSTVTHYNQSLDVIHTPGHTHGHIALHDKTSGIMFTGDTVIPQGTVWIGPPDGHLRDYLQSLDQLIARKPSTVYPGHGVVTDQPDALMTAMKARRLMREHQIITLLQSSPKTLEQLTQEIYKESVPTEMNWVALKTVQGHLQKIREDRIISVIVDPLANQISYYVESTTSVK